MKFKFFKIAFLCVFCSHTALSFPLTGQWKSKYNEYFFFQDLEPNKKRGKLITQRPNGKIVNKTYKILKQNSKNEWVISILNPLLKENKNKIENYSYSQKSKVINVTGTISMKLMGKIHKSEYKYTLSRVSNATTPQDKQAKGYSAASKKRDEKSTKMLKAAQFVSQKKYTDANLIYSSLIKSYPLDLSLQNNYAHNLLMLNKKNEAYRSFNKVIKSASLQISKDPKNAEAFYDRGWAYRHKNQLKLTIKDFKKAVQLKPLNKSYSTQLKAVELEYSLQKRR